MQIKNFEILSYDDFIADNEQEIGKLKLIIENKAVFPSSKNAIILHGAYGAGKTHLARMIPRELERHRIVESNQDSHDEFE